MCHLRTIHDKNSHTEGIRTLFSGGEPDTEVTVTRGNPGEPQVATTCFAIGPIRGSLMPCRFSWSLNNEIACERQKKHEQEAGLAQ